MVVGTALGVGYAGTWAVLRGRCVLEVQVVRAPAGLVLGAPLAVVGASGCVVCLRPLLAATATAACGRARVEVQVSGVFPKQASLCTRMRFVLALVLVVVVVAVGVAVVHFHVGIHFHIAVAAVIAVPAIAHAGAPL